MGDRDPTQPTTLSQQISLFASYLESERRCSAGTVAAYCRDLRALESFVIAQKWPQDAAQLDTVALRTFLATLYKINAPATLARKLATLRAFYRFMRRRGFVKTNPAATLRAPKLPKRLPHFLTVDDALRLMCAPNDKASVLVQRARGKDEP